MEHMDYSRKYRGESGWIVEEMVFDPRYLGKCEAVFTQGNGYLGVRNALEERYIGEQRGMFVNGTFNRAEPEEVPELPNFPDITAIDIFADGFRFELNGENFQDYRRQMNYKTGETTRRVIWTYPSGKKLQFVFRRFVSLKREHAIGNMAEITALDGPVEIRLESGIDARMTNTGVQHFKNPDSRIYEKEYLQTKTVTRESQVTAVVCCANKVTVNGGEWTGSKVPYIRNRRNLNIYTTTLQKGDTLRLEKISGVYTSRDKKYIGLSPEEASIQAERDGLKEIRELHKAGYEALFRESEEAWENFWKTHDIRIESKNVFDQPAVRFAVYHLHIMNKPDDNRLGIGAKGLSGEEYKGHSFWDTEIFLMPYYLFTNPKAAKNLLEYRYYILEGARKKAAKAGYQGAMYPWEAAWIHDEETCADIIGVDVETGKPMRVLCGEIEVHISADVAYAVWEYYTTTKDKAFMEEYGYEILLETARFWASRSQWNEEKQRYEIRRVIGPDEYKEEVDNDVYTNYMARYNMEKALEILKELPEGCRERLDQKLNLGELQKEVSKTLEHLYLPVPNQEGIIPQNDTYLSLKEIPLEKYKNNASVGTIHQEYSMERLKEIQVSKQGDFVVLAYLLEDLFDEETVKKNYFYYEEHTTHDSSLSKCTHAILANDLGMEEEAYRFYQGAAQTDIGPNLKSCDNGIHSASCGGIWQCVVMGFGGVRIKKGELQILPRLPKNWESLDFQIQWRGKRYRVHADHENTEIIEEEPEK